MSRMRERIPLQILQMLSDNKGNNMHNFKAIKSQFIKPETTKIRNMNSFIIY